MQPTVTDHQLPLRPANFRSLAEALDYAARGETGINFFSARGKLTASVTYRALSAQARTLAWRLLALGLPPGSPVALVAETNPDFMRFFFACSESRSRDPRSPRQAVAGTSVRHRPCPRTECHVRLLRPPRGWADENQLRVRQIIDPIFVPTS